MAKPSNACGGPWRCHHGAYTSLVEEVGDLFVRVGIDEAIDLLHHGSVRRAQHDTRFWQRQIERPRPPPTKRISICTVSPLVSVTSSINKRSMRFLSFI